MKNIKIALSFLFFFLFMSQNVFATHVGGGNISYTCTGNPNEYEITLVLYRDCGGISAPASPNIVFSNSCGLANPTNLSLTLDNVLTAEISQLCPTSIGLSECNGGTFPGYEQYYYTGLVTFSGPCDSWDLDYNVCDRNPATNLVGTNCFHITTSIYSATDGCNNSPEIITSYPIPYVCNNQPVSHDFGVVEADGDELVFSFVNAQGTGGSNLGYQGGYSAAQPIPGIAIDPTTGLVTFTPTLVGNFVVTVMVTELNVAGNIVGTMLHDIQFVVENCINQGVLPPINGTNFDNSGTNATFTGGNTISMCAGDQFCVDIVFTDPDLGDELFLGTNALAVLPGATFTQTGTNPATATLCWTYTDGYTANLISINATDSACPTISNASFIINLDIPPPLNASPDIQICGSMVANLEAFGTAPVVWSVISGDPLLVGTNFTCNPCSLPTASPTVTTVYQVVEGSSCNLTDQVTVSVLENIGGITTTIVTPDTSLCVGDCFNVNAVAAEVFSGVTPISNTASAQYALNNYSTATSYINVSGLNMTNLTIGSIQSVCLDIDHNFVADLDIYLVCPDNTQFLLSSDNGGAGDDYSNTCFTVDATDQINLGIAPFLGNYVPEGGVLSGALLGCSANGSWSLQVGDDSGGNTGTLNSWTLVLNDDIPNVGVATSVSWTSDIPGGIDGIADPTDPTTEICGVAAGLYTLTAFDVNNCGTTTNFNITMATSGDPGLDSTMNICKENVEVGLFSYVGGTPDVGGLWFNAAGDTITEFILPDTIVSGSIFEYEVIGTGCPISSFITVNVIELTETHLFDDSDCQASNGSISITAIGNLGPITYSSDNGATTQVSNVFDNLMGGVTPVAYTILIEDSLGCQTTFTQDILDDNYPSINTISNTDSDCGLDNAIVNSTTASGGTAPYMFVIDGLPAVGQALPISDLAPGTYDLMLTDAFGCTNTESFTVDPINDPIITGTPVVNNICNTGSDGEIQVNGNNLNFYSLDGGTVQTSNTFTGLPAGIYEITAYSSDPATTTACDFVKSNIVITEPDPLNVYDITAPMTSCPGDEVTFQVSNEGGMGSPILTWFDGLGNTLGTGNSITFNPNIDVTLIVRIEEGLCPIDEETSSVTMPIIIKPRMIADKVEGCYPVTVGFTNTSTNQSEIQTTNWQFSPNNVADAIGFSPINATYDAVGIFDVTMTITSIHGCIYDTTYVQHIETFDYPEAIFTYTPNPPTIYEPEVDLTSLSSEDVVQWSWSIVGGTPTTASTENVEVSFPQGIPAIYPTTLTVWNEHLCMDEITGQIEVINDVTIFAPNVFTPDGDEFNETWRVYINGIDIYEFHLIMYNRWGETVWESYDTTGEWDGTYSSTGKVEDGTYVWIVNAKDTYNDKKYEFKGAVTISR
jgi:gliding motility-associated-like protein